MWGVLMMRMGMGKGMGLGMKIGMRMLFWGGNNLSPRTACEPSRAPEGCSC